MKTHIIHHCLEFEYFPHEKVDIKKINWSEYPGAWMAKWTTDFDCSQETQFWYVIKDTPFSIDELKAKRRYEINKGNKNFYTKVINPAEYKEQLYHVYCESLRGYEGNPAPIERRNFYEMVQNWANIEEQVMFGCFRIDDDSLCGYADIYRRNPYLPISSLKTIPEMERGGVNFALIYGILSFFDRDLREGCYLCDGSRVLVHKTHFQDFLEKYFGFRKAYCVLHVAYRFPLNLIVKISFPFHNWINRREYFHMLTKVLMLEAWKRGIDINENKG